MSAASLFADPERGAGLRHAVLQWHSLQPADRDWLLAQLDVPARQQVQALLREIDELGVVPRRTCGKRVSTGTSALPSRPDPGALGRVLAGEPPLLIARLLAVCTGPWRDGMLNGLDATQAAAVLGAGAALGPMLASVVVSDHDIHGALYLGTGLLLTGLAIIAGLHFTAKHGPRA